MWSARFDPAARSRGKDLVRRALEVNPRSGRALALRDQLSRKP